MKTIKEIKDHFSTDEIKILIEIIRGRQDFDIMETAIKDFYEDEFSTALSYSKKNMFSDRAEGWLKENILEKLEFDFEMGGLI